jgi:hypothetical protein
MTADTRADMRADMRVDKIVDIRVNMRADIRVDNSGRAVQIKEIVKLAPRKRQTLLFSATMTEQVQQLVTMSLKSPVRLAADAAGRAPEELRQEIVRLKVCTHSRSMGPSCSACSTVCPCVFIDCTVVV